MDNWNPNSVPYNCLFALDQLRMVGFDDMSHPVFVGIKKYLNAIGPDQWHFTIPSNQDYPHAIFHSYGEEYNKVESIGIVIGLSAFIIEHCQEIPVYEKVLGSLDDFITRFQNDNLGDMGPSDYITLISAMKRAGIAGYDYDALDKRLNTVVNNTIQRDPVQSSGFSGEKRYRENDFLESIRTSSLERINYAKSSNRYHLHIIK